MIMQAGLRIRYIIAVSVITLFVSQAISQTGFKTRPQAKMIDATWVEYWGATGDTTVDATEFFQACINNAQHHAGAVNLGYGKKYLVNGTLRFPKNTEIHWNGNGAIVYSSTNDTTIVIYNGSQEGVSISATENFRQPRHVIRNTWFVRRISFPDGLGTSIMLINTTNVTLNHLDFYGFNSAVWYANVDSGWCESNTLSDTRIARCDTAIKSTSTNLGNSSGATNFFEDVTITGFDSSAIHITEHQQAVGMYFGPNTNGYRQKWSNSVIFLTDSTTGIYTDGILSNITGDLNMEIIGTVNRVRSRAFHFGPLSTDLKFNLHFDFTGRRYLDDMMFNQSAYTFGPTGLTTTVNGANQNHGITTVVDTSKFTPLFAVGRADHLGNFIVTPGDTAYWFFANINDGQINLRGWRDKDIDMRAIADGRYSSVTAFSFNSSTLPLQPIRAILREAKRTDADSTQLDVRNANYLLYGSNTSAIDSLVAFKGGLTGQTLRVQFLDDSTVVANLARPSGSGRLFMKDNHDVKTVAGLRMEFICEAESGGFFWRETNRTWPDDFNTLSDNDPTPDASKYSILRLSNSGSTSITDFLNDAGLSSGRFGKILTLIFLNGNTTVVHNASKIILGGSVNFVGITNATLVLQYDGTSLVWREVGRSGAAAVVGTVDSTNIVDGTVSTADLRNTSVDSTKIRGLHVTATKLASGSVLNAKIASLAIDSTKIAASMITSTKIKDGEVLTADLAAQAITFAKLANALKLFQFAVDSASAMTADTMWVWQNMTGGSVAVDSIHVAAKTDDYAISIVKSDYNGKNGTLVDAVTASTNGTNLFFITETTITSATIASGQRVGFKRPASTGNRVFVRIHYH